MIPGSSVNRVAIACGGTGGHLFPGLAVAEELSSRGTEVLLLVSTKDVDQRALRNHRESYRIEALPVVGFSGGNLPSFLLASWQGYRRVRRLFDSWMPAAVVAMGGFTSAAPVLAGRRRGAFCFLHESNAYPGRANRWLARIADECFLGFAAAAPVLSSCRTSVTGTPVRAAFRRVNTAEARMELGLAPDRPVLLVMGGSQGAHGVNQLAVAAMPALAIRYPELQFCHVTGPADSETVRAAYAAAGVPALVFPFSDRMDLLLAAASVAISRSGASSLAEIAAVRVPSVLLPYPAATDDHQRLNAAEFVAAGAARMLDQRTATPEQVAALVGGMLDDAVLSGKMRDALAALDAPGAAVHIADGVEQRWALPGARLAGIVRRPRNRPDVRAPLKGARTGVA